MRIDAQDLIDALEDPEVKNAVKNLVTQALKEALAQRERDDRTNFNPVLHRYFYEKNITYLIAKGGPAQSIMIGNNNISFAPKDTFVAVHDPRALS